MGTPRALLMQGLMRNWLWDRWLANLRSVGPFFPTLALSAQIELSAGSQIDLGEKENWRAKRAKRGLEKKRLVIVSSSYLKKTGDISRRHHCFVISRGNKFLGTGDVAEWIKCFGLQK